MITDFFFRSVSGVILFSVLVFCLHWCDLSLVSYRCFGVFFCRPGWLGRCSGAVMATDCLSELSRKHGVKKGSSSLCIVEEAALAVGEVVGHSSIKSVARMCKAVVLFLERVEQVNKLVEKGIAIKRLLEQQKSRCRTDRRSSAMIF